MAFAAALSVTFGLTSIIRLVQVRSCAGVSRIRTARRDAGKPRCVPRARLLTSHCSFVTRFAGFPWSFYTGSVEMGLVSECARGGDGRE